MIVFLWIMGAMVMVQLLYMTEKGKKKNLALKITYVLCVVLWPFANFVIMVILLFMLRRKS